MRRGGWALALATACLMTVALAAAQNPGALATPAARRDATVRVLPGLNHFLQHARNGVPAEIPAIDETMAPEALGAIADWVVTRFGGSR